MLANINESIKVKLTQRGIDILKMQHNEFKMRMLDVDSRTNIPEFNINDYIGEDGYYTTSLYVLMDQFGEHMSSPLGLPFESNFEMFK